MRYFIALLWIFVEKGFFVGSHEVRIQPVAPCTGYSVTLGETNVALNCTVDPDPTTYKWYHGNKLIGEGHVYVLSVVKKESEGLYRCAAYSHGALHGNDTVTVTVNYPPTIKLKKKRYLVNESSDLQIPCTVDSNPPANITWKRLDGEDNLVNDQGVLHLDHVTKDNAGTYLCSAVNVVTDCQGREVEWKEDVNVTVDVLYTPTIKYFSIHDERLQEQTLVKEGASPIMTCNVDSFDGAKIKLLRGDIVIAETSSSNNLRYQLKNVDCYESGTYSCSASNDLGRSFSEAWDLVVQCSPQLQNNNITKVELQSVCNGNATFTLTVLANPRPVFSLRDAHKGRRLVLDSKPAWDGNQATGSLTLTRLREDQFRNYVIRVANSEGSIDVPASLMSYGAPTHVTIKEVTSRSITMSLRLNLNTVEDQILHVKYKQQNRKWFTFPIMPSTSGEFRIELDNLEPSSLYWIQLRSESGFGSSDLFHVDIKTKDVPLHGFYSGLILAFLILTIALATILITKRMKKGRGFTLKFFSGKNNPPTEV